MGARRSRARGGRARTNQTRTAEPAAEAELGNGENATAEGSDGKLPSHLSHHRMIARNLNGLLENYGELRKQVVDIEREFKRTDKDLDSGLFQLRNRVDALEKKLLDFIEEMTTVAFESNLKIRGNSDQLVAIWETLAAVGNNADEVVRRRDEAAAHEEARQAEVDRRLQDLVEQQQATRTSRSHTPRTPRKTTKKK